MVVLYLFCVLAVVLSVVLIDCYHLLSKHWTWSRMPCVDADAVLPAGRSAMFPAACHLGLDLTKLDEIKTGKTTPCVHEVPPNESSGDGLDPELCTFVGFIATSVIATSVMATSVIAAINTACKLLPACKLLILILVLISASVYIYIHTYTL